MPPSAVAEALLTDTALLTASAKLPDDLVIEEFHALLDALWEIEWFARKQSAATHNETHGALVRKVQYGSDFLVILAIAGGVGGGIAGVLLSLSKAIDVLAAAGLKNEQRLGKKEKRLERREARSHARLEVVRDPTADSTGAAYTVIKNAAPDDVRKAVDQELTGEPTDSDERTNLYYAVEVLAEYGVQVGVDED